MNYKAYIINFDKGGIFDPFNYATFHTKLTTANGIITWWHHMHSSYIIITNWNTTATNVADYVRQIMPNKHFLVIEVDLNNHNGYLPKEAWDWINNNKNLTNNF